MWLARIFRFHRTHSIVFPLPITRIFRNSRSRYLIHDPSICRVVFFHRKSNNDSVRDRNSGWSTREDAGNAKRYFYCGAIVLSSIVFLYVYERWNNGPRSPMDRAELYNEDVHDNLLEKPNLNRLPPISRKKEKSSPIVRGKYSEMNFFADIVEQVSPSVAFIESRGKHPFLPVAIKISSGSGFLVDKQDGIILTNAHVIANCQKVAIQFNDGRVIEGAVEFVDERLDLATVRVPVDTIHDLEPIPLADSRLARAGEWVMAVGAPFSLSNTVTVGVISSISRAGRELGVRDNIEYIQTDASINIGNSGGPLLNLDGEAIGINTLKVGEGISFAIPSFYVQDFLDVCRKYRHNQDSRDRRNEIDSRYSEATTQNPNRQVYLGFTIVTLTPQLIETHRQRDPNFPEDVQHGVMVYRVVLGAPAHLSGLQSGDIILAINGKPVQSADEVYRMIQNSQQKEMEFLVKRGRQDLRFKIKPHLS